jgi:hypothetical protein
MECIKNSNVVAKECMDKDEAIWVEFKLGLDPNSELKSISLINMTHPSLEEALDKTKPRITNPREILDNKMTNERQYFCLWTFMKKYPWSLKRKVTLMSMKVIS